MLYQGPFPQKSYPFNIVNVTFVPTSYGVCECEKKPARRCVVSTMGTEEPSLFEEASPKRVTRIGNRQPNALFSIYLQQLFAQRETAGNVFF